MMMSEIYEFWPYFFCHAVWSWVESLDMPVFFSWLHLSADSKYAKIEGWLALYHLATTHSVNFVCLETIAVPGKAHLLNDTYLITTTYKIVNGEALKI